jgi:hypothetical protein
MRRDLEVFSCTLRGFAGVTAEHATDGEQTGARMEKKKLNSRFLSKRIAQARKVLKETNLKGVKVKVVKLRPKTK